MKVLSYCGELLVTHCVWAYYVSAIFVMRWHSFCMIGDCLHHWQHGSQDLVKTLLCREYGSSSRETFVDERNHVAQVREDINQFTRA